MSGLGGREAARGERKQSQILTFKGLLDGSMQCIEGSTDRLIVYCNTR